MKIKLDVCQFMSANNGIAIVCSQTGVFLTAQCGGIACSHPEVEGFPVSVFTDFNIYDDVAGVIGFDCKYGCWEAGDDDFDNYGRLIDEFLSSHVNNVSTNDAKYYFDFNRKKEIMEGWWPVSIHINDDAWYRFSVENSDNRVFKGYLHFGNCD